MAHTMIKVWVMMAWLSATSAPGAQAQAQAQAEHPLTAHVQRFDFSRDPPVGAGTVAVQRDDLAGAPRFGAASGYGFVEQTGAIPARAVHVDRIERTEDGYTITEAAIDPQSKTDDYNNYGMAFRIKAAPGAYAITVRTTSDAPDTTVSITGMQGSRIATPGYWDAASLLPVKTTMAVKGRDWSYRYVNGRDFIDIEVEPKKAGVAVGLAQIVLTPIALRQRPAHALPTIFLLGDSTVKSYTFDEAPMSGWGQVIDRLFDPARVRLINYSMGGRSFRNAYAEGRLNDLLLAGYPGDTVMIQFGHNDESTDETRRFGRGATEAMYEQYIRDVYLRAIRARGMVPVFITPMSRVNGAPRPDQPYVNSFNKRRFPDLLRKLGPELVVPVVDLNARSVEYYNAAGQQAVTAMVMAIEAGETPGTTNDGSYANGHPANKVDGTHYKEAMSRQYARLIVTELARLAASGDRVAADIAGKFTPSVRAAVASGDWSAVYPEIASDIVAGNGAYYRNQIEKLLQLGVLRADAQGKFNPQDIMRTREFAAALSTLMRLPAGALDAYPDQPLTRGTMGAMLADAYHARFTGKPAYMTDYNGKTALPGSPGYDPNLDTDAQGAMYYPLVRWDRLQDTAQLAPLLRDKLHDAYELGLIRAEAGIERGRMVNGRLLEPQRRVTRAKAAKALYFMWVLAQAPKAENG